MFATHAKKFPQQGMVQASSQNPVTFGTTQTALGNWTAEADSTISGSDLKAIGTCTNVTISVSLNWTNNAAGSRTITSYIYKNGSQLTSNAISPSGNGTVQTQPLSTTTSIAHGDLIEVQCTISSNTNQPTLNANSSTFCRLIP